MTSNKKYQTALGLHFDPDNMGPSNYPVTAVFWNKFREQYETGNETEQIVIEAAFHTIGEFEHNTPETGQESQELEMAVLGIEELVTLVLQRGQY